MTPTLAPDELLAENDYIDVQEWIIDLGRDATPADIEGAHTELGIEVSRGAVRYTATYHGPESRMDRMKATLARNGGLTISEIVLVLKHLRQDLASGRIAIGSRSNRVGAVRTTEQAGYTPPEDAVLVTIPSSDYQDHNYREQCAHCHRWFRSQHDLLAHKPQCEVWAPVITAEGGHLDISSLPDGFYAYFDPSRQAADAPRHYLFLRVKTVTRTQKRDRAYRCGKLRHGKEIVKAGTIEVRVESGGTRRLCGEQRPGEGYRGEYSEPLIEIMKSPELWATIYASVKGCCYVCAKDLTDDTSRTDGIGPDCFKRWGLTYFQKWSRAKQLEAAAKRQADAEEES